MENAYLGATPAYGKFQKQIIIGDGSTASFSLDYPVSASSQILVSVGGVLQEPEIDFSAYTTAGQGTINFSSSVGSGVRIFILFMGQQLLVPTQALSSPHIDSFTSDGSTTTFTLTRTPSIGNGANVITFANGTFLVYGTDYSTTGANILLNNTYTAGTIITAIQLAESNNVAGSVGVIPDNSITAAKLSLSYTLATYTGDGSTTSFGIDSGHDENSIFVFYNGICLTPTTDYSISTNQVLLTFPPIVNSEIMIRYLPV
jgi:hypothetical protein